MIRDILSYLDFLNQSGHAVTVSCFENKFEPYTEMLLPYDIHPHAVCGYLKQSQGMLDVCVKNKGRLLYADLKEPIYSCCYAGVEEYVFPIRHDGKLLMCVHLSGYRGRLEKSQRRMRRVARHCEVEFLERYAELEEQIPSLEEVRRFIKPLEYMVIALYRHCLDLQQHTQQSSPTKEIYLSAMKYIHEHYMQELSCEVVAENVNFSTSYLQYVFRRECESSVNRKITEVRIQRAKYLLQYTGLTITEIAYQCGFSDSNYFSVVFRQNIGCTPTQFRKQMRK